MAIRKIARAQAAEGAAFEAEIAAATPDFAMLARRAEDIFAFCRRLRDLRIAKGLSQAQLAAALGISQPRISEIEGGGPQGPTIDLVMRYARACGHELSISFAAAGRIAARGRGRMRARTARPRAPWVDVAIAAIGNIRLRTEDIAGAAGHCNVEIRYLGDDVPGFARFVARLRGALAGVAIDLPTPSRAVIRDVAAADVARQIAGSAGALGEVEPHALTAALGELG